MGEGVHVLRDDVPYHHGIHEGLCDGGDGGDGDDGDDGDASGGGEEEEERRMEEQQHRLATHNKTPKLVMLPQHPGINNRMSAQTSCLNVHLIIKQL